MEAGSQVQGASWWGGPGFGGLCPPPAFKFLLAPLMPAPHPQQVGESWYTDNSCSRLCTCSAHNNISCRQASCKPSQMCWPQDGLIRCRVAGGRPLRVEEDLQPLRQALPNFSSIGKGPWGSLCSTALCLDSFCGIGVPF